MSMIRDPLRVGVNIGKAKPPEKANAKPDQKIPKHFFAEQPPLVPVNQEGGKEGARNPQKMGLAQCHIMFQAKQNSRQQQRSETKVQGVIDVGQDFLSRQAQSDQAQNDNEERG